MGAPWLPRGIITFILLDGALAALQTSPASVARLRQRLETP
jgi:hypothetical protein